MSPEKFYTFWCKLCCHIVQMNSDACNWHIRGPLCTYLRGIYFYSFIKKQKIYNFVPRRVYTTHLCLRFLQFVAFWKYFNCLIYVFRNQCKCFQNAIQCGKRICEHDVATRLKSGNWTFLSLIDEKLKGLIELLVWRSGSCRTWSWGCWWSSQSGGFNFRKVILPYN